MTIGTYPSPHCQNINYGISGIFSGWSPRSKLDPICESCSFFSSALMAEALAIRSVVMYDASSNVKSLMIMSDSQSLVKLLKRESLIPVLFGPSERHTSLPSPLNRHRLETSPELPRRKTRHDGAHKTEEPPSKPPPFFNA
ncbi:hypothetical protein IGI04_031743 [Brassica rapa subsp. trilocularis]|uniref:RNase H type-1 domain-containing protein n=1 Tax=Brassica rapa subsp. trilocularis TaxID=1813537 RepID=A0ABQ7LUF9_BRACM|nr:hypothetical protein IGI04_031743 [Brassica rapa subsp. trilocularis]